MSDSISREEVVETVYQALKRPSNDSKWIEIKNALDTLPSARPEHIQNNSVHLCDSCQYTFPTCPSYNGDVIFGDGKGNDNICACNKYRPKSAQPEPKKGKWNKIQCYDLKSYECTSCGKVINRNKPPAWNFCPHCGADMRGEE